MSSTISPDVGEAAIDERRMLQVLINLLTNAIKFTPEGGSVTLKAWSQTSVSQQEMTTLSPTLTRYICFSVTDTGIGIAPTDMPKLFRAFVQIDSRLNRQYSGTGLGLALVKRVTELHGGWVNVKSQPREGSCFTVFLPDHAEPQITLSDAQPSEFQPEAILTDNAPIQPSLILLVEDNPANVETYSNYLIHFGYRLIVAANGLDAIAMTKQEQPALILMDIQMPEMDGLAAIQQIRSSPELANIPIIALTALAMPNDREKCLEAGADEYLAKPVRLRQLANTIAQLLSIKE